MNSQTARVCEHVSHRKGINRAARTAAVPARVRAMRQSGPCVDVTAPAQRRAADKAQAERASREIPLTKAQRRELYLLAADMVEQGAMQGVWNALTEVCMLCGVRAVNFSELQRLCPYGTGLDSPQHAALILAFAATI